MATVGVKELTAHQHN